MNVVAVAGISADGETPHPISHIASAAVPRTARANGDARSGKSPERRNTASTPRLMIRSMPIIRTCAPYETENITVRAR